MSVITTSGLTMQFGLQRALDALDETAETLTSHGDVLAVRADLTSDDDVAHLIEAWRYPLPRHPSSGGYQLTPLAIDGVLYAAAADRVGAV